MENKPIYVAYVGVGGVENQDDVAKIMKSAYDSIGTIFNEKQGEVIFIPVRGTDSRLECINPRYVTEEELIRKHRLLIDELHEHLDSHLKELLNNEKKAEE
jgi:hypothetical protein